MKLLATLLSMLAFLLGSPIYAKLPATFPEEPNLAKSNQTPSGK